MWPSRWQVCWLISFLHDRLRWDGDGVQKHTERSRGINIFQPHPNMGRFQVEKDQQKLAIMQKVSLHPPKKWLWRELNTQIKNNIKDQSRSWRDQQCGTKPTNQNVINRCLEACHPILNDSRNWNWTKLGEDRGQATAHSEISFYTQVPNKNQYRGEAGMPPRKLSNRRLCLAWATHMSLLNTGDPICCELHAHLTPKKISTAPPSNP